MLAICRKWFCQREHIIAPSDKWICCVVFENDFVRVGVNSSTNCQVKYILLKKCTLLG